MRILSIHADRISYNARVKTKIAEPIEQKEDSMEQCVVFLTCVEKSDEDNPQRVVEAARVKIAKRLGQLKVNNIMIFPYAHLSSSLSSPQVALEVLRGMEVALKEGGFNVKRAPFGWYKGFEIKSKCHPLADLSMTVYPYEKQEDDPICHCCGNPLKRTGAE